MSTAATFKRKGHTVRYSFSDRDCIGRDCWAPGMYQHRGAVLSGSRNTGSPDSPCCLNRAYHGCPAGPVGERKEQCHYCHGEGFVPNPDFAGEGKQFVPCNICGGRKEITICGLPLVNIELGKKRKAEGWKFV